LHTFFAVVAALGSHVVVVEVLGLYLRRRNKGKEVEWATEANLQGTNTIAGCSANADASSRCRKMCLVLGLSNEGAMASWWIGMSVPRKKV
jgi:hypothetical protein